MKANWWWKVSLLLGVLTVGCVTQTERIPYHRYYDPPENESALDELRREFGWQKPPPWVHEEPFYKQAARGVKETVAGWFKKDESTGSLPNGLQTVQEFQRVQKETIQRMQQKTGEVSRTNEPSGLTNESAPPATEGGASEE